MTGLYKIQTVAWIQKVSKLKLSNQIIWWATNINNFITEWIFKLQQYNVARGAVVYLEAACVAVPRVLQNYRFGLYCMKLIKLLMVVDT